MGKTKGGMIIWALYLSFHICFFLLKLKIEGSKYNEKEKEGYVESRYRRGEGNLK